MQEGLKMTLLRSLNVSGAQNYHELCMSAKNEERRLLELKKGSLYSASTTIPRAKVPPDDPQEKPKSYQRPLNSWNRKVNIKKCYNCGSSDHLLQQCRVLKKESTGRLDVQRPTMGTKTVQSLQTKMPEKSSAVRENPIDFLLSSDSEGEESVRVVKVEDEGSKSRWAEVELQGVPTWGIVDTGSDITIVGGKQQPD